MKAFLLAILLAEISEMMDWAVPNASDVVKVLSPEMARFPVASALLMR